MSIERLWDVLKNRTTKLLFGLGGWIIAGALAGVLAFQRMPDTIMAQYIKAVDGVVMDLGRSMAAFPPKTTARPFVGPIAIDSTTPPSIQVPSGEPVRIGVHNFSDFSGARTRLGTAVAATFTDLLNRRIPSVRLINRSRMAAVFDEQDLADSGRISKKTGAKIGKMSGAEYLLTGQVQRLDDRVIVVASLLDSTTGETLWTRTTVTRLPTQFRGLVR